MMSQWQVSIVTASVDSSKSHIAAVEIFRHLQLYASGHITQQELDEACLFIKSNIHQGADTVGDLADWYSRDVIRRRPLTSAEQEIEQIENLTIQNIANATTAMFVDSRIQAVVVDPDAPFWVEDLGKLRSNAKKIADQDKINTHYDAGIDALATKRAEAPERYGYGWAAYYSLAFVVWMAGVFCPTVIPEPGQAVSLLLYTIDYNWQYGVALYVPYGIAAILAFVRGRYEKLAERYYIALNFAVAMVFAYGYFAIFGPTQLSELPWYGTVLAVLQIVFFLVATPVAFIALLWYLWLRRPARRV